MTALLDTEPERVAPEQSSRATTTPRDAWRRVRLPVVLGAVFVVIAVVQAIVAGGISVDYMDPEGTTPDGARALATLLRDHGVEVRVVETPSGSPATTVFVPSPALARAMRQSALSDAAASAELVVAEPDEFALEAMRIDAGNADRVGERVLDPGCAHPDAVAAGAVRMGGYTFGAPEDAVACYAAEGEASFVELTRDGRRVTLLGTASFMTNHHLDDDGNAALALRVLTRQPRLEWVYPRVSDAPLEGPQSLLDLLPHRLVVAVAEVCVAVLLLALWRMRRLGPVVVEPLPVVVRAAEAVEGRARLYEAAHARDQAANALRAGLRDRLVRALGLTPDADMPAVVGAVTARSKLDPVAVTDLLYGPPPADDAALVRLADDLDRLDNEVRAL